jgi:hypothetical protein
VKNLFHPAARSGETLLESKLASGYSPERVFGSSSLRYVVDVSRVESKRLSQDSAVASSLFEKRESTVFGISPGSASNYSYF